jgi:uncharacterized protein
VKVVVTGATGFIGSALVPTLVARGHDVVALSRDGDRAKAKLGVPAVTANLEESGSWTTTLAGAGAIVHLAGESVAAKRWDAREKQVIRDSRVEATRTIVEALATLPAADRPRALISASGTDYYPFVPDTALDDDEYTETDPPGESFLARVCRDWEKEAMGAEPLGVRVTMMRTGLVLGSGGPLAKMTTPFKLFVGGKLGDGKQWVSWIHLDDVIGIYLAAITDERYRGPLNVVTASVRNRELSKVIGNVLNRPSWLRVPGFAVRAVAGELADYVLDGRNVVPKRLVELGYVFKYPELAGALRSALAR